MSRTNHIADIGPRYSGRKNKSTPRTANDQCHAIIGGSPATLFVKRKPPEKGVAMIPIVKGGHRCPAKALVTRADGERRCSEHINHI